MKFMKKKTTQSALACLLLIILAAPIVCGGARISAAARPVVVGYYEGDPSFQDGFSDEVRKSGYAYEYLQAIASRAGWRCSYVYGTRQQIMDALLAGEVDLAAGVHQTDKLEGKLLFSRLDIGLSGEPRYFAVNPGRPELLEELDRAQAKVLDEVPGFTSQLNLKYYANDAAQLFLTEEERLWLKEKGSLRAGYVRGNLPISAQLPDGSPTGVAKDLADMAGQFLRIPIEPVCYDDIEQMEEALRAGEIDAAFPSYSDPSIAEGKGFCQTAPFLSDRAMIVYLGNYRGDLMNRVALSRTGIGQRYYVTTYYPDARQYVYNTREETFAAMQRGEADCMIGCSSILQHFLSGHREYEGYNVAYLDSAEEFGIAVNQGQTMLLSVLNKAIRHMDRADITSAMVRYAGAERPFTLKDAISRFAPQIIVILCIFAGILLWIFLASRSRAKKYNEEQAKTLDALESALSAANAASRAKTAFLSNMSHDIRTPMNGIIGMTAIAAAHLDEPTRIKDCLEKITSSGKHLLGLINEVLDMSKIESGKINMNEESFNLPSLLNDTVTLNRPSADAKKQDLVVHIVKLSHEAVDGDPLRLQQVFTNLVSNAIKYTPEGGRIEVTLTELHSGSPRLGRFSFTVEDNGIGMSEEFLPHIFDVFARAEDETGRHTQGTGLGMAITRSIVRMLDGDVKVESRQGEGSKFTASFGLKLAEAAQASYDAFVDLGVLVADDDPVVRESVGLILSELGMCCDTVATGEEAVALAAERHELGEDYFAILVDWKMPGMNGLETAVELHRRIGEDTPIVIISAYDLPAVQKEAVEAGVDVFIEKPLFKSRLVHAFGHILGKEEETGEQGLRELTESADYTGKRALMAEDNELNAEIAMEILQMTGLTVDWAHDGQEAVDMYAVSEGGYDCIFMDVKMPVLDGLEAARAIRRLPLGDAKTIPIIAMTANAFAEDIRATKEAGMDEHIAKPLDFDILIHVLDKYLGD